MTTAYDAKAVSCIAEGWMLQLPKGQNENIDDIYRNLPRPSQSPNRVEVLTAALTYRHDNNLYVISDLQTIQRNKKGRVIGTDRLKDFDSNAPVQGSMTEILTKHKPTQYQREQILEIIKNMGPDIMSILHIDPIEGINKNETTFH